MITCGRCGAISTDETAAFCGSCGVSLHDAKPPAEMGNPVGVPQTPPVSMGNGVSLGNPVGVPQTPPVSLGSPPEPPPPEAAPAEPAAAGAPEARPQGTIPGEPLSSALVHAPPAGAPREQGQSQKPFAPPKHLSAGTLIDKKYAVLRVLGEGGMGVVYL